jgi:hypothetical protein
VAERQNDWLLLISTKDPRSRVSPTTYQKFFLFFLYFFFFSITVIGTNVRVGKSVSVVVLLPLKALHRNMSQKPD